MNDLIRINKRNLLSVSIFIFFYYYSGASISGASMVGMKITITNQEAIIHLLWACWLYFYIKYLQYFYSIALPILKKETNQNIVRDTGHVLLKMPEIDYHRLPNDDYLKTSIIKFSFDSYELNNSKLKRRKKVSLTFFLLKYFVFLIPRVMYSLIKNLVIVKRYLTMDQSLTIFVCIYPIATRDTTSHDQRTFHSLEGNDARTVIKASLKTWLFHPEFTEYVVPLILALIPLFMPKPNFISMIANQYSLLFS